MKRHFSDEFKAKVALEALKEEKTLNQLGAEFDVHPNLISQWKQHFKENMAAVFTNGKHAKDKKQEKLVDSLYKEIGALQVQTNWLKKKLGISP